MKLIKFQNVSTWWDWALFCWYHLTQVPKWVKLKISFDHVKTSFCWKRCANSRQMHCFAFRYRTGSKMIMKRYETLNSIHPVRLSTFVTFWHSVWSNTSKNWRFRGPAYTHTSWQFWRKLFFWECVMENFEIRLSGETSWKFFFRFIFLGLKGVHFCNELFIKLIKTYIHFHQIFCRSAFVTISLVVLC